MYSFSISEPVTTEKKHLCELSVEVIEKPPIEFVESFIGLVNGKTADTFFCVAVLFMGNFGSVVLWCRSPWCHFFLQKTQRNTKKVSVVLLLTKPINDSKNSIGGFSVTLTDNSHWWFDRLSPVH